MMPSRSDTLKRRKKQRFMSIKYVKADRSSTYATGVHRSQHRGHQCSDFNVTIHRITSLNAVAMKSAKARAEGLAARPAGKMAWMSAEPMCQLASKRTNLPSFSSLANPRWPDDAMPMPATAAAATPSLLSMMMLPCRRMVSCFLPLWNVQASCPRAAAP